MLSFGVLKNSKSKNDPVEEVEDEKGEWESNATGLVDQESSTREPPTLGLHLPLRFRFALLFSIRHWNLK